VIARVWLTRTTREHADEFDAYLRATGMRDIPATPGNCGVYMLRRARGRFEHFGVISLWTSEAAIAAFAGTDDPSRVRYYPRDAELLLDMPVHAQHYEVVARDEVEGGIECPRRSE